MYGIFWKKAGIFVFSFLGIWLGCRFLLPVAMPFLLGLGVALAAEPAVALGEKKLPLPRWLCSGVGVSLTLILLMGLLGFVGSLAVKELGQLANKLPDLKNTVSTSADTLEGWLTNLAQRTPQNIRPILTGNVHRLFEENQVFTQRVSEKVLTTAENMISGIPGSALGLGITLISAFMISQRLPKLKSSVRRICDRFGVLSALGSARSVVGGWLLAQLKLSGITFGIVTVGLLLFGVRYAPLLALGIAVVDALPVLGTGIVLLPWSMIALIQGDHLLGIGLIGIYGAAVITRTVLEPRLVGHQLGLDPLLTLVFLYAGFRFWGVAGMLLTPILAASVKCVLQEYYRQKRQK